MKTVGVRHLSVPDKSYQNHCCYLTQYPPSNTHHQYYFRQLEHCVNIWGNIFSVTQIFLLTWYSRSSHHCWTLFYSWRSTLMVPFSAGLGPTTEKRCSEFLESLFWIEHTLFQWNNILYLVTINFVLYDVNIVNIPLCTHRAELLTIVPLSSSLSRLSILFMKHITDIEFLTLTNYPPIIQRDTLRTISGNSN